MPPVPEVFPPPALSFDLEDLLRPISEGSPSGEGLRYEGTYDRILDARRADESDLPQGVWKTEVKVSDWREVERLCLDALKNRSKDIQIALWLTESWMNRFGFGGLRHGLELVLALCERYWDSVHPEIRDDDLDFRVAPFVWLSENLSSGVLRLAIIPASAADDLPAVSTADWQSAMRFEQLAGTDPDAYERELGEGRLTIDAISQMASRVDPGIAGDVYGHCRACAFVLLQVDDLLTELCGRDAPSLRRIRNLIRDVVGVLESAVLPACGVDWRALKSGNAEAYDMGATSEGGAELEARPASAPLGSGSAQTFELGNPASTVQGRAQAYRALAQVADYLMRIEPHSPTPYLIRRAVSWERKTLIELMTELLRSPDELAALHSLLGIPFRGYQE